MRRWVFHILLCLTLNCLSKLPSLLNFVQCSKSPRPVLAMSSLPHTEWQKPHGSASLIGYWCQVDDSLAVWISIIGELLRPTFDEPLLKLNVHLSLGQEREEAIDKMQLIKEERTISQGWRKLCGSWGDVEVDDK